MNKLLSSDERVMNGNDKFMNIESNTSLAAPGALTHRLQRRTTCNTSARLIQHGRRGVEIG